MKSFYQKLKKLTKQKSINQWEKWFFNLKTNFISEFILSHEFFTCFEHAVFQTVWTTKKKDWYSLSDSTEWWKDNYDFEKYDWNVFNNIQKIKKYELTLKIIYEQEKLKNVFDQIQLTETEFAVSSVWLVCRYQINS